MSTKDLAFYENVLALLGEHMTDEQAECLFSDARQTLSLYDLSLLSQNPHAGGLYTLLSQFEGEMGGFARYL